MPLHEIRVVIASPGDVQKERNAAVKIISELNRDIAAHHGVIFREYMWETDVYPGFGEKGIQGLIDPVLNISNCEIVVGIFWKRFGTPVPGGKTGTEHELRTAYEAWSRQGYPRLMVYFNETPYNPTDTDELEQWIKVLQFKKDFFGNDGLRWSYVGQDEFEKDLRSHLIKYIYDKHPATRSTSGPSDYRPPIPIRELDAYSQICDIARASALRPLDVFSISAHNLDEIYEVDRIAPDYETEIQVPIKAAGGSGANTAFALAQLGLRVALAGAVGQDEYGRDIKESLASAGVRMENLIEVPSSMHGRTGRTIVLTDRSGRRSIFVDQGVNEAFGRLVDPDPPLFRKNITDCRNLHVSSFVSAEAKHFCERQCQALSSGAIFTFTPGTIYSRHGLQSNITFLARANVVFLYQEQFESLIYSDKILDMASFRDRLEEFFEWRSKNGHHQPIILSIKRSRNVDYSAFPAHYLALAYGRRALEALIFPESETHQAGAARMNYGLGAGDALAAGVIYSVLNGLSSQNAANFGHVMANLASSQIDSRMGLRDRDVLRAASATLRDTPPAAGHTS